MFISVVSVVAFPAPFFRNDVQVLFLGSDHIQSWSTAGPRLRCGSGLLLFQYLGVDLKLLFELLVLFTFLLILL